MLHRFSTIIDFVTFFLSLTLHAVILLLWKKKLSLNLFSLILTHFRVCFMGDQVFELKGVLGRALLIHCACPLDANPPPPPLPSIKKFPSCFTPILPWSHTTYWQKVSLTTFTQIFYPKLCLYCIFSVS